MRRGEPGKVLEPSRSDGVNEMTNELTTLCMKMNRLRLNDDSAAMSERRSLHR